MTTPAPKVNYLSNKELLKEIHRSKNSYCYFLDKADANYDAIVDSVDDITEEVIHGARIKRAAEQIQQSKLEQKMQGLKNHQLKVPVINPEDIDPASLVFRVMTYEHIPAAENPKEKVFKTVAEHYVKTNFPPFKHYKIEFGHNDEQTFVEVGRSHWRNGFDNGEFCLTHGNITNQLAKMFLLMVDRYGQKPNWRGYSYLDEMKNQSLMQLIQVGLKFDEKRSQNPFAYYTTIMANSFTGVFHKEKRNQNIRDDVLIMHGQTPSNTRQVENEIAQRSV